MMRIGCICLAFAACAGDDGMPFADDTPPAARKRIFYLHNGTLGKIVDSGEPRSGVEIADAQCTAAANERGLGPAWRAWLSSSSVDAIDRIEDVAPWYRDDQETLLFATKRELGVGPRAAIEPARDGEVLFWTGTDLGGRRASETCADWTVYLEPATARVGRVDGSGAAWVVDTPLPCANYLAVLCIEQ